MKMNPLTVLCCAGMTSVGLTGCGLFPTPVVTGRIPPALTQERIVYSCDQIKNELKLAHCYLKSRRALYLDNQDKRSLQVLDEDWHE